jgi:hypothetical protein
VLADAPVTTRERLATASTGSDLTPGRGDLNVLIASGMAAHQRPERMAGLRVKRMIDTGDIKDLWPVVEHYDAALAGYLGKKGRRPMPEAARRVLISRVLTWLMGPGCEFCGCTGHIAQDGTAGTRSSRCAAPPSQTARPVRASPFLGLTLC